MAEVIFYTFLLLALIIFLNLAFQVLLLIAVICHISDTYINLQKTASIKIFSLAITYVIGHKSSIHSITLVALINSIFLRLIIIFFYNLPVLILAITLRWSILVSVRTFFSGKNKDPLNEQCVLFRLSMTLLILPPNLLSLPVQYSHRWGRSQLIDLFYYSSSMGSLGEALKKWRILDCPFVLHL